ncbi:hypothetical protein GUITHDRAFT_145467 [Guillardia theta CCMP2712]|uniref:Uncharacterized protein n=1 Tax=Guillardia theta (strain CCMP2712) TaxID=905079 RepID=L1IL59_GUITC|nr:hypothetical protein GUITHDRAFT_145467 [Guillardia theta CCMP2712]EKX36847.1 hypothetical protein GUITHDRAFT_145467 [Guillardia theta CCMP2712]|eukprot:XP_005823827.1 hypothetical protein GUITHDRAFT_145467 [Guillardia theta CCMP2712]
MKYTRIEDKTTLGRKPVLAKDLGHQKWFQRFAYRFATIAGVFALAAVVLRGGLQIQPVRRSKMPHLSSSHRNKLKTATSSKHEKLLPAPSLFQSFEFRVPNGVKAGSEIHVLLPGLKELQTVKLPSKISAGEMLSIQIPMSTLEEEEKGRNSTKEESRRVPVSGEDQVVEEVEAVADDVEMTWHKFFLLIVVIFGGSVIIFQSFRGIFYGFEPLEVDAKKIVDHPCRHSSHKIRDMADKEMSMRAANTSVYSETIARKELACPLCQTKQSRQIREVGRSNVFIQRSLSADNKNNEQTASDEDVQIEFDSQRDDMQKAATADPLAMFSQESEPLDFTSNKVFDEVWMRGKWLLILMIFQSLSGFIMQNFEDLIQSHVVIALFMTMLIGCGGNAGGQSVAKAVHEIADQHIPADKAWRLVISWAAWVRVWFFHGGTRNSVSIALSSTLIVFVSIILGGILPYTMHAMGFNVVQAGAVIQPSLGREADLNLISMNLRSEESGEVLLDFEEIDPHLPLIEIGRAVEHNHAEDFLRPLQPHGDGERDRLVDVGLCEGHSTREDPHAMRLIEEALKRRANTSLRRHVEHA